MKQVAMKQSGTHKIGATTDVGMEDKAETTKADEGLRIAIVGLGEKLHTQHRPRQEPAQLLQQITQPAQQQLRPNNILSNGHGPNPGATSKIS